MQNVHCARTHLTVINRLEFSLVNLSFCDINQSRAFRWVKTTAIVGAGVCVQAEEAARIHKQKIQNIQRLHLFSKQRLIWVN